MSDLQYLLQLHETQLHQSVRSWILNPSRVYSTCREQRLQILSPGMYNIHGGPDFTDAALLINSSVITCSLEFDKYRSCWATHHHIDNPAYRNVALHLVLVNDLERPDFPDALVIPAEELKSVLSTVNEQSSGPTLEEVQGYALLRLLRLSTQQKRYYEHRSATDGLIFSIREFLSRYQGKRRRPTYTHHHLEEIVRSIPSSPHAQFLNELIGRTSHAIPEHLSILCRTPIWLEGEQLRMEIMTNCIIPSACILASDNDRVSIFTWYWSAEAVGKYSILRRRFPDTAQRYVWQQQGLLEMLRDQRPAATLGDVFRSYGTLVALDFYNSALEPPQL